MSKWEMVRLGDVCEINPPKKQIISMLEGKEVSFVPMSSVDENGNINVSDIRAYSEVSNGFSYFKENDVLFAKITPCMENGKGAIAKGLVNGVGVGSTEFHVLRPDEKQITSEWIFRYLSFSKVRKLAEKNMTGSAGQKRVPKAFLDELRIPLPPLDVQKQIAGTLDKAQEIIDGHKKQLEELDNLIKATFYDMFGDPFDEKNNQTKVPLSKISDIMMGQSPQGDSYNNEGLGTPLLNGPTEFGKVYPTEKQWTTDPTKLCEKDDILFCVRGATAGRMNYADKQYCIGRGLAAIRVKDVDTKEYIYSYLGIMYDYFQSTSNGSTFINISKNQLETLPIIYPSREKQILFSKITRNIEEQKAIVRQSINESQNLFNSLMSKYFD